MEESTAARIREWDRREVGDGRVGLSTLADGEFSGAVEAGGAWLFVLNGRIVGESGGSVESIGARDSLTAYTAPHPSLPLLFAMWEHGGNTQGRYFTDDTELAEVHDTLSSGRFTGYIELSENVHSGDYYVVYYGGRALFAAFVGSADRLVTGEEAFERANDEVGIYEVTSVDLDVRDVPEPSADANRGAGAGASPGTGTGSDSSAAAPGDTPRQSGRQSPQDAPASGRQDEAGHSVGPGASDPAVADDETGGYAAEDTAENVYDPNSDAAGTPGKPGSGEPPVDVDPGGRNADPGGTEPNWSDASSERPDAVGGTEDRSPSEESTADIPPSGTADETAPPARGTDTTRNGSIGGGTAESSDDGVAWDDGTTVPALDPERTAAPPDDAAGSVEPSGSSPAPGANAAGSESETAGNQPEPASERIAELESELEELQDRVESLSEERDRLAAERDRVTTERDELETQLEDILAEEEAAEADLNPSEALSKADLFVRYDAKSQTTLDDAHDGDGTPETLGPNLRLETHTRFETDDATVNGEAFESFLRDTLAYRFVSWLTGEFIFEIRDTGNETALRDIYDALPEIDRVEFDGTVTSRDDDGEELRSTFDVVFRNKMGEPLLVADTDEGRDPTDGGKMAELLDRTTNVVEAGGSISGVFVITASFFDNDVHETVKDETKTGFFDRDSRASFVKTSRNNGYHVCLVEAHGDRFHLSRPDL